MDSIIKKLTAIAITLSMVFSTVPAYAGTYNTDGSATVPITATVEGSYTVTLPALLELQLSGGGTSYLSFRNNDVEIGGCVVDLQKNKAVKFLTHPVNILKDGVATDLYVTPSIFQCTGFINMDRTHIKEAYIQTSGSGGKEIWLTDDAKALTYDASDDNSIEEFVQAAPSDPFSGYPPKLYLEKHITEGGEDYYSSWEKEGGVKPTQDDFMAEYGPAVYTADLELSWKTVTIPAEMLQE